MVRSCPDAHRGRCSRVGVHWGRRSDKPRTACGVSTNLRRRSGRLARDVVVNRRVDDNGRRLNLLTYYCGDGPGIQPVHVAYPAQLYARSQQSIRTRFFRWHLHLLPDRFKNDSWRRRRAFHTVTGRALRTSASDFERRRVDLFHSSYRQFDPGFVHHFVCRRRDHESNRKALPS